MNETNKRVEITKVFPGYAQDEPTAIHFKFFPFEGFVKWDGCCEIHFTDDLENGGGMHICDFDRFVAMVNDLQKQAKEYKIPRL